MLLLSKISVFLSLFHMDNHAFEKSTAPGKQIWDHKPQPSASTTEGKSGSVHQLTVAILFYFALAESVLLGAWG
jgi:hypothetical protein